MNQAIKRKTWAIHAVSALQAYVVKEDGGYVQSHDSCPGVRIPA